MLMANPVHGTHLHGPSEKCFRFPEADQKVRSCHLRERCGNAVSAPVGDRRDHQDIRADLGRGQGQPLFHRPGRIAHADLVPAVADADGRDLSEGRQEQGVTGRRFAADIHAPHVGVDAVLIPSAALHGDEAHRLIFLKKPGRGSILRVQGHVDRVDSFRLEIAFAVAVRNDHRGEAESLQRPGKGHGSHGTVRLRIARDIEARGKEDGAPLPA